MQQEILFNKIKIFELINPSREEILNFAKKLKIKEVDLRNSLTAGHYAEFIYEKKYLAFQLIYPVFQKRDIHFERVGLFLTGENLLLVRQEDQEIQKIKTNALTYFQKIKLKRADFLMTLFIFYLVRRYFSLLKKFSKELVEIEIKLKTLPPLETIKRISQIRRNLIFSHTAIKSILTEVNQVIKNDLLIKKNYSDRWEMIHSNANFILNKLEDYREILEGLNRSFESKLSLQINESIRFLTLIQLYFLPAMLISSIYGMNISLPLAKLKYAFLILLGAMIVSTVLLIKLIKK